MGTLYLGISKLARECTVRYLPPDRFRAAGGRAEETDLLKYERCVLRGRNLMLSAIETDEELPLTGIDFLKGRIRWMARNIYKNLATWDAEGKVNSIMRQIVTISCDIHYSDYKIRENVFYDEGTYMLR